MTKRRRKIIAGSLIVIVIVMIAVLRITSVINQPLTANLKAGPAIQQTAYNIDLSPVTKVSKYASFNYPAGLRPDKPTTFGAPVLEQFNFRVRDVESWVMTVNISDLPAGQLSQSSSYSYRKAHPTVFQESHESVNNQQVDLMTDLTASGFDQVAYLVHGSKVGIISLVGNDSSGTAPLQKTFDMVLHSWQWQ